MAISRGQDVRIYIDKFKGNEPLSGATVDVDVAGTLLSAKPDGEGVYVISSPAFAKAGAHDLAITIQAPETVDILTASLIVPPAPVAVAPPAPGFGALALASARNIGLNALARLSARDQVLWATAGGSLILGAVLMMLFRKRPVAVIASVIAVAIAALVIAPLPAKAESKEPATTASVTLQPAIAASRDLAQRFADGAIFVPKPTQRVLAIRTLFTEETTEALTVELPARVIPDPNRSGVVQASVSGRLLPPQGGFPRLGTPVKAGDVLATVVPAQALRM